MAIPQATASEKSPKGHRGKRAKRVWKDKHWRWVSDGNGDWRVQGYIVRHRHKPARNHFRGPGKKPAGRAAVAALPAAPANPDPRPAGAYQGQFGAAQAVRLLNRAGFGPVAGQAEQLASLGLVGAVQSLTRPKGSAALHGPAPVDDGGDPIAPADAWGHDHLWWLDRMVRGDQPLVERMALVLHDWFATSQANVSTQQQMIDQSNLFRGACFDSFLDLFKAVTIDPAMLQWLNGNENTKYAPNENYAREMMELFSLGADRGAYSEDDIREQARALTGWRNDWGDSGAYNFRYDPKGHDGQNKTVFGQTGNWGWEDACRLCVENPLHPSFFVEKLWGYFVAEPLPSSTRDVLIDTYRGSGWAIRPVLETILTSPQLYEGGPMVKPPVVHLAGMLRALGRPVDTEAWIWLCDQAGQVLFWPPNVSGWDDRRWLDTSRMRARWNIVDYAIDTIAINPWGSEDYSETETADEALARATASWGSPALRDEHRAELLDFSRRSEGQIIADWQQGPYRAMRQNGLLQLIGISPDLVLQ
jgi:Protein of unknown function (DUF1800)